MSNPTLGIDVRKGGQPIESVQLKGLHLSLIAAGDGTEIIHHRLSKGTQWAVGPIEGWRSMECVFVLSGQLGWDSPTGRIVFTRGDSFTAMSIQQDAIFVAEQDTEFLYISSQPVFHMYSRQVHEMADLAVSIEMKDGYTASHCERIKRLAMAVGGYLNLSPTELYQLDIGSFFHDLGKLKIPEAVLLKPGKLTSSEWETIKLHPQHGRQLMLETRLPYFVEAAYIVEQHHERFNGSGYPNALRSSHIAKGAAIVAVVDSFDAMTSDRPYHKGRPRYDAVEEIARLRGSLYDPDVVDAFLNVVDNMDQIVEG